MDSASVLPRHVGCDPSMRLSLPFPASCTRQIVNRHTSSLSRALSMRVQKQVAALHGHAWTRRALDAMARSPPDTDTDIDDEETPFHQVDKGGEEGEGAGLFRLTLRFAGGRELVWEGDGIEGLEEVDGVVLGMMAT